MNIKKEVLYIFSILIIFGFVLNFVNSANHLSSNSVVVTGDGFNLDNWTLAGLNSTVNFTLNLDGSANNITNITIEIPGNVLVFDLGNTLDGGWNNGTYTDSGTWSCGNTTAANSDDSTYTQFWECLNDTTSAITNVSTFNIWFNFTANKSIEDYVIWNISTQDGYGSINTTEISINADGLAPRLSNINVSDGYTVLTNDTLRFVNLLEVNVGTIDNGTLRGDRSLTVTAEFEDFIAGSPQQTMLTGQNVYMYYYTTYQDDNVTQGGNGTISGQPSEVIMTTSDLTSPYKFTGTITGLIENNITSFVFLANDSFNQLLYRNNSEADGGASAPYAVLTNTTNTPSTSFINISDGTYSFTSLSSGYLRSGQIHTINVDGTGRDLFGRGGDSTSLYFFWNTTGNLTTDVNGHASNFEGFTDLSNLTAVSDYSASFNGTVDIATGNNTNIVYFAIIANSTNQTGFYLETGYYGIDDVGPTGTAITSDDVDNRISVGSSVTFTCSSADGGIGVKSTGYVWKVSSGGSDTQVVDQTGNTLTLTSSSSYSNTNKAGEYTAKCTPYDSLGHIGVEGSLAFVLTASTGGSSGGGSSSSTTSTFDADLSTAGSASISGIVGRIKSFSFDGKTKHTVTFKEITATYAKITIASTPIDVVLNIGESKEVDINADGTNDLKVTLDKIKFGTTAEVTISKLEIGARKVVEEEREVVPTEESTLPTETKSKSMGWLVTTLLVIVILVIIGYYAFKKK